MEEKRIDEAIHAATYSRNVRKYKEVKDFYKDAVKDIDITSLKIDVVNELIEVFEWILDNPDYDYKSFDFLEPYNYTDEELNDYFKVYYEKLIFIMDKYNKKEYIIKLEDFD